MLNPSLLLLDEPMEGLAPIIMQDLKRIISDVVAQSGMTVILVEQHARIALSITQSAIVLERGQIVHRSDSAVLSRDTELLNRLVAVAYFSTDSSITNLLRAQVFDFPDAADIREVQRDELRSLLDISAIEDQPISPSLLLPSGSPASPVRRSLSPCLMPCDGTAGATPGSWRRAHPSSLSSLPSLGPRR